MNIYIIIFDIRLTEEQTCFNVRTLRVDLTTTNRENLLSKCHRCVMCNVQQQSTKNYYKTTEKYIKSESRNYPKCNEHSFFLFCFSCIGSWVSDNNVVDSRVWPYNAIITLRCWCDDNKKTSISNEHYVFFVWTLEMVIAMNLWPVSIENNYIQVHCKLMQTFNSR